MDRTSLISPIASRLSVIFRPPAVRVYVATQPVNLRKSYDGLSNEVRAVLAQDPLSGHVFVFLNRRKNQVEAALVDARRLHHRAEAAADRTSLTRPIAGIVGNSLTC